MGGNRRNTLGYQFGIPGSRRFQVNHFILNSELRNNYISLLLDYEYTKFYCQQGKEGHDQHVASIQALKNFLTIAQKNFQHR